ncbi:hypothetical protein [Streptomyces sp. NBC_01565]|uniref:hypothetical protein n=1 Tax=unclassified Streptomyces TaxID=2593676 RepID=UPI002258C882|nr:hypothetical protein [Streptomyces sp. NBC_01565]MCX4546346.1 hypothetical protein [Streptomyces sp. NBC_01565]
MWSLALTEIRQVLEHFGMMVEYFNETREGKCTAAGCKFEFARTGLQSPPVAARSAATPVRVPGHGCAAFRDQTQAAADTSSSLPAG